MQSFSADHPAIPLSPNRIHAALARFADEVAVTTARLFAYVGVLALFGILGLHGWDELRLALTDEPPVPPGWNVAGRSSPGFALSPQEALDTSAMPDTYAILRHPSGGRKDILRWSGTAEPPAAELEIYRPGDEYGAAGAARAELAGRMPTPGAELAPAGVIESKFGSVVLLRRAGARDDAGSCLGFLKRVDDPALQISGWSCQGSGLPARRAAIACMLNRLTSLSAGNEPKLAEFFAHAELRRGRCAAAAADWMSEADDPALRGAF